MTTDTITVSRGEMTLEQAVQLIDTIGKDHKSSAAMAERGEVANG